MARLSLVPGTSARHTGGVEVNVGVAHVAVAQAVATALAIDLDFDLESVDEVRIATDEACAELAGHADPHAVLHLVFDASDDALEVVAQLESDDRSWPARIGPDVVRALTDRVIRTVEDSQVSGMHILRTWFRKAARRGTPAETD
jgi:serine/threonine-protein kinase RsbW